MRSKWLFKPVAGTKLTLILDDTQSRKLRGGACGIIKT